MAAPKRPKNLLGTLHTLNLYMGRSKFLMLAVAIFVSVSALANLVGTYMIKPVVNAVGDGDYHRFVGLVTLTAIIYAVGVASAAGYTQLMVRAAQKVVLDIRRDLFDNLLRLPLSYFDSTRHGDVMSLFTNDVDTVSEALNNSFASAIQALIQTVGTLVLLVVLDWRLTIITLACDVFIVLYVRHAGKRSAGFFAAQQATLGRLDGYVQEMMSGQKVVKAFTREGAALEGFDELNEALRESGTAAQAYATTMVPMTVSVSYVNFAIVCVVGSLMTLQGLTDVGSLASYLVFVRQACMPINQLTQQGSFLLGALAGAERVFAAMELEPEVDAGAVTLVRSEAEAARTASGAAGWAWRICGEDVPLAGDVRFYGVDFGYRPEKDVLKGLTLFAKPGQKIAFVGSTGAGKTTITNLINRFYEVRGGVITYDGIDVRDISKESLRRSLGIVLQDTHLFAGTIADNIRFGKLDATDEEVRAAARVANADGFISRMPQGYQTPVVADGANLSQGQRQLIAIARAAVADPPVLILDEATSSIDTRTEALIQRGMDALMRGRTVFVIAHRLSTVRNADAIMVLERGRIIERGTHDELLSQHGEYWQLYTGAKELD